MGANVSASMVDEAEGFRSPTRLDEVPENCLALVMTYLDPPDVCRIARLSRAFRAASSADFVWEPKLPENYRFLIDRVFGDSGRVVDRFGKREVFAALSRPNSFDGGNKEIWLDKVTGGVHLLISSKGLRITGIDDRRYWSFIATEESSCVSPTNLVVRIGRRNRIPIPHGPYSVFVRLHLGRPSKRLGRRVCNNDHVHGWAVKPVKFQLATSDGQRDASQCYLESPGSWVDYRVGSFAVENPNLSMKVKFSATQIDCTRTKGGVCVDSVLIRPDLARK